MDNDNSILFFKIWRNSFIRKKILTDCLFFYRHSKPYGIMIPNIDRLKNHKFKNYITSLHVTFDDDIPFNYYSPWIEKLNFNYKSRNKQLSKIKIPSTVQHLTLNYQYLTHIGVYDYNATKEQSGGTLQPLPETLETLIFGDKFSCALILPNSIPRNLKKLIFGEHFNQPLSIDGTIPSYLEHLEFNNIYALPNVYLDTINLYQTLVFLKLPIGYNKSFQFNKCLNLKTLGFDNYKISQGDLPSSLTSLEIYERYYKHPLIEGSLPINLNKLKLNFYYSIDSGIEMKFPKNLKILILDLTRMLSKNQLTIQLPESVTDLTIDHISNISPIYPTGLLKLTYGYYFNLEVPKLPEGLLELTLGHSFNRRLLVGDEISKLKNLKSLTIAHLSFDAIPNNYLPNSLKHLEISYYSYKWNININLPSLETLTIYKNITYSNIILNYNFKVKILK